MIKGEATSSVTRAGYFAQLLGVQLMKTQQACPRAALDADTTHNPHATGEINLMLALCSQDEVTTALRWAIKYQSGTGS